MDITTLPFEKAMNIYYELIHAIEIKDEHTIRELSILYPSLFEEETLQTFAETAERVRRAQQRSNENPLFAEDEPRVIKSRRERLDEQINRVNELVRENPEFFMKEDSLGKLYIELAVDKLIDLMEKNGGNVSEALKDTSGKIVPLHKKPKK